MKKFFSLLLLTVFFCVLPSLARAEKNKFKDENFNFKQIKTVQITNLSSKTPKLSTYTEDINAAAKVLNTLEIDLQKRHIKTSATNNAPINIQVTINALGTFIEHVAAYDETKTVDKKTVGKDAAGHDVVVTIPAEEVVHHEAKDITHAIADLTFIVTDNKTGAEIYTLTDSRERSNEDDTSGMLGRICKDFAKDISRN